MVRVVTFAVAGRGLVELPLVDAVAFAASVRRVARSDDPDEQQVALTLETTLALAPEAVPLDPDTHLFLAAVDMMLAQPGEPSRSLLELRQLLAAANP